MIKTVSYTHLIMGNHDYRALRILERFDIGETPNPHGTIINSEDLLTCKYWIKDGGKSTVQGFLNMSLHERSEFLDYFRKMPSYQKVTCLLYTSERCCQWCRRNFRFGEDHQYDYCW